MKFLQANRIAPDRMRRLIWGCILMFHKRDARLKQVKQGQTDDMNLLHDSCEADLTATVHGLAKMLDSNQINYSVHLIFRSNIFIIILYLKLHYNDVEV